MERENRIFLFSPFELVDEIASLEDVIKNVPRRRNRVPGQFLRNLEGVAFFTDSNNRRVPCVIFGVGLRVMIGLFPMQIDGVENILQQNAERIVRNNPLAYVVADALHSLVFDPSERAKNGSC